MLEPVMRPRENCAPLVPDELLMVEKTNSQQTVEHFARELRCVPHIRRLEARYVLKRFGPIGAGATRDFCFLVAFGALLHVRRLRRPAAIQACSIAPFGI